MYKYNFDEVIDRHNTFSDKWDILDDKDVIPLWVADMDFKAAPAIYEAVNFMASQGVYGRHMKAWASVQVLNTNIHMKRLKKNGLFQLLL